MEEEFEISLFPIPGAVSFPETIVPLHVFEPRYRLLIKEAVTKPRRIGVCHTKRVISPAKHHDSTEQALRSNQATYEPVTVFGAGFGQILDITDDGRLLVEIEMDARYEIISEVQTLPYKIVRCRRFDDIEVEEDDIIALRESVTARLIRMSTELSDELAEVLRSDAWKELSDEDFSFKIFQIVRLEPEMLQQVLEMRTPRERLRVLNNCL